MLDELMGRNRNNADAKELEWHDADVCKYYLVDFCPHELFTNTKADLGPCGKIHDDEMRNKFNKDEDNYRKTQTYDEFLRFCNRMLTDLQNRIKKAKDRLLLTQTEDGVPRNLVGPQKEVGEKITMLSAKIADLVDEAEKAGCEGNVEQAQGLMKLSDQLKEERETLRRSLVPHFKDEYQHQKAMEVCDTCGAFLIVGDAQQRIDDHLMGKQHIGYARLRATVERIQEERKKAREARDKEAEDRWRQREKEAEERRKMREKESEERKRSRRDKERKRSRSRSRDRRRSRDRDRDRDRAKRSRSRDRKRRSRSRDRRRSRSRDRRRSRSRGDRRSRRSSRSRSRERRRKSSRSRERSSRDSRDEKSRKRSTESKSKEEEPRKKSESAE